MRDRLKVNRVSEILGIKVSFSHETKFEAAALLKEFSSSTEIRSVCRNILSDAVDPPPPPFFLRLVFALWQRTKTNIFYIRFFSESMQIKLCFASSCTAKRLFYLMGKSAVLHLHEGHTTDRIQKRRKKPSILWDLNPRPLCCEACAQQLCYNHSPSMLSYVSVNGFILS